jgi:hypothetical protein
LLAEHIEKACVFLGHTPKVRMAQFGNPFFGATTLDSYSPQTKLSPLCKVNKLSIRRLKSGDPAADREWYGSARWELRLPQPKLSGTVGFIINPMAVGRPTRNILVGAFRRDATR